VAEETSSSLFTFRDQSVRITSVRARNGEPFLKVEGPYSKRACYEARDERDLADIREQLEEALVAQGFASRVVATERRAGDRRSQPRTGDRRTRAQTAGPVRPCPPDWASELAVPAGGSPDGGQPRPT
jgi:hypothetical protein